jgi:hypothetical protein
MNITIYRKAAKALLSLLLALAMIQSPIVLATEPTTAAADLPAPKPMPYYRPFTEPVNPAQAKITIEAAEKRPLSDFNLPIANDEFWALIQANQITKLIDDSDGFWEYFLAHRARLLNSASSATPTGGQPPMNWQLFLARAFVEYKIDKTAAQTNPEQFQKWVKTVVDDPWVQWASWKTWAALVGLFYVGRSVISFAGNVAYGSVIAGPGAGAVNAYLGPGGMNAVNQWLTVKGNKHMGPLGVLIASKLFDGASVAELESARKSRTACAK